MKKYLFGTVLVSISAILFVILMVNHTPKNIAAPICISIGVIGFIIQMLTAFSIRSNANKEITRVTKEHTELLEKAKTLPPEEEIKLLLKK